jgi:hypothetical protein
MPILRKLTQIGESKGITLPKSWIENAEEQAGKKMVAIALEVDQVITLQPIFEKKLEEVTVT